MTVIQNARARAIRTEENPFRATSVPAGDYVSPGLEVAILDELFPHMIVGEKANHPWPYLRGEVPHNWYCDDRFPTIGFLNRDEVLILYNIALKFRGKPALEIGSWMGWSTCHLALAGAQVDTLDPIFAKETNRGSLESALNASGLSEQVSIIPKASPDAVHSLAAERGVPWSLFFIDGNHDAPHVELDATACLKYAAQDALFVFHDLASPDVERGLAVLRNAGFKTLIYQTMQIMGVAWRGDCAPIDHTPDPMIDWKTPPHLRKYRISGEGSGLSKSQLLDRAAALEEEVQQIAAQARLTAFEQEQESARIRAQVRDLQAQANDLRETACEQEQELSQFRKITADVRMQAEESRAALATKDEELSQWRGDAARLRVIVEDLDSKLHDARRALEESQSSHSAHSMAVISRPPVDIPRRTRGLLDAADTPATAAPAAGPVGDATSNVNAMRRGQTPGATMGQLLSMAPLLFKLAAAGRLHRVTRFMREWKLLLKSGLFDEEFYEKNNADAPRGQAAAHYLLHATEEGRDPNPLFATGWYLKENPDVAKANVNPLLHYLRHGAAERRDPSPAFATSWYLSAYPDVAKAAINPLVHYLKFGWREGRNPHPRFDSAFYLEQHPECGERNPLLDFLEHNPDSEFVREAKPWSAPEEGICIVTPDILGPVKNGGIGTACFHFATALAQSGRQVTVLYAGSLNEPRRLYWRDHYAKLSITFVCIDDTPPIGRHTWGGTWFLDTSWRIFSFLRDKRFECVHFQDWQANGFWSIRAKRLGIAFDRTTLTVTMHSCSKWIAEGMAVFPPRPVEHAKLVWCETACMQDCDILLSPSHHMFDWAKENSINLPADHRTMPYVMPPHDTAGDIHDVDNSHLMFFGRLETRKGLHIFGDALRLLAKSDALPSRVTLLGKHAEVSGVSSQDYIAALAAELPQVKFDAITNLDTFQAQAYVRESRGLVVVPSTLDNYPLVILECILNKLPFLASATGGIVEMVDPSILFEPNSQDLARILRDRANIDHNSLHHQYDRVAAKTRWLELHDSLRASPRSSVTAVGELPRVSVCIPFFRHGRFLQRLLNSFVHQDYPDFEVILVNDGSGPEFSTEFETARQENSDKRFQFITIENSGPGAARNTAAHQATGKVLLFFDSDNLPKDERFLTTAVTALLHANVDCLTIPYDVIDHELTDPTEANVKATFRPIGSCVQVAFVENVLGDATLAIRRDAFEAVGGFPEHRGTNWEDWEFLVHLVLAGTSMTSYPDALYFYRDDPKGRNRSARKYQCHRSRIDRYLADGGSASWEIVRDIALPLALREYT